MILTSQVELNASTPVPVAQGSFESAATTVYVTAVGNAGSRIAYIGGEDLTASNGFPVESGEAPLILTLGAGEILYGLAGTADIAAVLSTSPGG